MNGVEISSVRGVNVGQTTVSFNCLGGSRCTRRAKAGVECEKLPERTRPPRREAVDYCIRWGAW